MTISSAANKEIQWWVDNMLFATNFITHGLLLQMHLTLDGVQYLMGKGYLASGMKQR